MMMTILCRSKWPNSSVTPQQLLKTKGKRQMERMISMLITVMIIKMIMKMMIVEEVESS